MLTTISSHMLRLASREVMNITVEDILFTATVQPQQHIQIAHNARALLCVHVCVGILQSTHSPLMQTVLS